MIRTITVLYSWNWLGMEASCRIPTGDKRVFPMVTGKDFVYAANTRHESYGSSFIILRDANQQLWLHGLGSMYKNAFVQLEKYYYRLEAPEIEKANLFAIHTYYYYLFYVVGNQIYQFDMVTKENRKLIPLDEKGKEIVFRERRLLLSNLSFGVWK